MAIPARAQTVLWYIGIYFGAPIILMIGLYFASLGLNWLTVVMGFLPIGVYELFADFYNGAWKTASYVLMVPFIIGTIGMSFIADMVAPYLVAGVNGLLTTLNIPISFPAWSPILPTAISAIDIVTNAVINLQPSVGTA